MAGSATLEAPHYTTGADLERVQLNDRRHDPIAPDRSLEQRMEALHRANEIRTRRAQLKRDLKARRETMHGLLLEDPVREDLATAKVYDLLLACPKYGRVKVNRIFQEARISASKTLGGLTVRQRHDLISRIR